MLDRIRRLSRRQLLAILAVVLVVASGAAIADQFLFTASSGVQYEAPDGLTVKTNTGHGVTAANPITASDTIRLNNVTFSSPGGANVTVDRFEGEWTNTSSLVVDTAALTVNPSDKNSITVSGDVNSVNYRSVGVDNGQTDIIYSGTSGTMDVTIRGVPANTQLGLVDDNGNLIQIATSNGAGEVTYTSLDASSTVNAQLVTSQGAPTVSDASPSGDLQSNPTEISANISDPDFSNGDSVDVVFTLDGTQIDSQTITSNQTVTTSMPSGGQTGGAHSYNIEATDAYGQSDTASESYNVPATIYFRNETNTSELVDDPVNITVRFFGDEEIFERTTDTGTLNMSGLPVNEPFIVEVDASEDYHSRTVYIDNIYQQETVYLLNTNESSIETRFTLDDPTGEYDSETLLFISKPIEDNGAVEYRTIHADRFGVEGVTATLEEGARYRIRVANDQGDSQVIGPYRGDVAEEVVVRPGSPEIGVSDYEDGWGATATLDNVTLEYVYSDPAMETTSMTVWIHERGNTSNQLVANQTYADLGNVSATETLTVNESEKQWQVNFIIQRNGNEFTYSQVVANHPGLVPFGLSDEWRLIFGIGMMFFFAGTFSVLNRAAGGIAIGVVGGLLWWGGWLGTATTGAAIVLYLLIAIVYAIYSSGG